MQSRTTQASGICFTNGDSCLCPGACEDNEVCNTVSNMSEHLHATALSVFNQTQQNLNMTLEERYAGFLQLLNQRMHEIIMQNTPIYCPTSDATSVESNIQFIVLLLIFSYVILQTLDIVADTLSPTHTR